MQTGISEIPWCNDTHNLSWKQQEERVRQKSLAGLAVIRRASSS